jgi:hypothetical protein
LRARFRFAIRVARRPHHQRRRTDRARLDRGRIRGAARIVQQSAPAPRHRQNTLQHVARPASSRRRVGISRQQRAGQHFGPCLHRRPEQEVGPQRRPQQIPHPLPGLHVGLRPVGRLNRNKGGAAIRMADRERRGGRGARQPADHRQALDAQPVQQRRERVGLVLRRRIRRQVGAQIAEPRRRDRLKAGIDQRRGQEQALVEAAAGAVDHQDRPPAAADRVLQAAESGRDDMAELGGDAPPRRADVAAVCKRDPAGGGRRRPARQTQPRRSA